ncbi:MAG: SUMF1/EgtB/PvdO family nonheme iron enzyme [Candidatus Tectomicrobia bacterium]|uniref:SUMF1/EgtB/PvdO family nonheme iron enzyme n=1 Tax=Tectimicrobiota bacterium TaxID=2528274 RepID=A0A932ZVA7_UNCTE|nr:SUMF1/EgtB/PvdO family nonheme iron enzyme [Candidatus Tectomicrobia bacterium]
MARAVPGAARALLLPVLLLAVACAAPGPGPRGEASRAEAPREAPPPSPPAPAPEVSLQAVELSDRGERAYRMENYPASERHFRAALGLAPGYLHALTGLAWTLYDTGRPDEAFPFFRRAHELFPGDGSARRGLGYLYYRYGERERARELLGSLDAGRWPELANVEDRLREDAQRGLPPPRLPGGGAPGPGEASFLQPLLEPLARALTPQEEAPPAPVLPPSSTNNMARIPGGEFEMGAPGGRLRGAARTRVKSFLLDKFEVTNDQFAAFVRAAKAAEPPFWRSPRFAGHALPVVGVTWDEARAFCRWAGKRLPTEAEWEYAARAGSQGRLYPWGDRFEERNAVYGLVPNAGGPKAVGRRPGGASLHGVEDLAGNVWEWVEDPFRRRLGDEAPVVRGGTPYRTLRGGSWVNGRWEMAATNRTGDLPGRRLPAYGFRCAKDAP